jgi:uncharacterized protein (UPF0332 family)
MAKEKKESSSRLETFQKEIGKLPPEIKEKLEKYSKFFEEFSNVVNKKAQGKSMGFYITPEVEVKNNQAVPNFDKLSFNFLLDDFEKPVSFFDPKLLLQKDFDKYLIEEKKKDKYGQEYAEYHFKDHKNIKFAGASISILRENCFDSVYDDLKTLGSSFVFEDSRGFISALKSIDIHRNMLLQKFEKYVVVYAGAGSWLRGEKSNDFDVFVVVDDTDVKRMSRMQVKDQLTRIILQMAQEVAQLTGIQVHAQVYLLTDFWDALKDAHPVMFTFLRDGVPFYDRGLYNSWKELLKLGKIRPSPEAIDMHMNVAYQLTDRAKKQLSDIVMTDVYYAVLNPAQAILMLKGYNPTTPKETVKIFKEVLLGKEKVVSEKDVKILEDAIALFKKIEHDRDTEVKGKDIDKMLKDADSFLKNMKKMFEEINDEKTKESVLSGYGELLNQIRTLPGFSDISEKKIIEEFEKEYVTSGKLQPIVKKPLHSIVKGKKDFDSGKITTTEVNKVLKDVRYVLAEIKEFRDRNLLSEFSKRKLTLTYGEQKTCEVFSYDGVSVVIENATGDVYEFVKTKFDKVDKTREFYTDTTKVGSLSLSENLLKSLKKLFKVDEVFL